MKMSSHDFGSAKDNIFLLTKNQVRRRLYALEKNFDLEDIFF